MPSASAVEIAETSPETTTQLHMANAIRALAMDAVEAAQSGHPGMPMGMADVATVLFTKFLKFDPQNPRWADRDRFILSAGHGSMLQYALLYLTGYEDITLDDIKNFRQLHRPTCGHPEFGELAGIETTTGPLGQGLANSVGFAMAERWLQTRFGKDLVDHFTYVIAGDGCLMEGISQEAISLAGHLKLSKLIVLFDDNGISIDGPTSLSTSENEEMRFEAAGWHTQKVDGHDFAAIEAAILAAQQSDKPSLISCKTIIGKGADKKAGSSSSHGSPLGADEIAHARQSMGWPHAPFDIPAEILGAWREAGKRGASQQQAWQQRFAQADAALQQKFQRGQQGALPENLDAVIAEAKQQLHEGGKLATRAASGKTLDVLLPAIPELLGGSADLTGSNNTKASPSKPVTPDDFSGNYIYYGIREHGMAAAMNGMALHGGIIPYSGTFFVFTDYCRPAIRLSALMKQRVIYVMTHDSIGLGEDGPTHQPVEHLASLRAMPNVLVLRPSDPVETAECWQIALEHAETPSILVLTRQGLPVVRDAAGENLAAKGGYILSPAKGAAQAVILATGSEVELAMQAQAKLAEENIDVQVSALPCFELFDQQPEAYQQQVLGNDLPKVAVEAGIRQGWDGYIGRKGGFVGMDSFGASAPAEDLYKYFGITVEAIIQQVKARV